ncbi:UNVERIFIED_CONTAM: hypothetical protein K2H54_073996 [Gekko kuhli]
MCSRPGFARTGAMWRRKPSGVSESSWLAGDGQAQTRLLWKVLKRHTENILHTSEISKCFPHYLLNDARQEGHCLNICVSAESRNQLRRVRLPRRATARQGSACGKFRVWIDLDNVPGLDKHME